MRYDTIDLHQTELQNARVHPLAAAPANPVTGQIYYSTAANILYCWNGTAWVDLNKQGTVTSVTAAGPLSSTGGTTPAISLNDSGVVAGTYTKVTVTAKGLITAGTTLVAADIPSLLHTKISDFDAGVQANRLDQMALPTVDLNMNGVKITGLANPVNDYDAATKWYVDATVQGLEHKKSVRVATTANIALTGLQTIDGVVLVEGDRVLVKNQTTASTNGIYVASAAAWVRADDADNSPAGEVNSGLYTYVEEGTVNKSSGWVLSNTGDIVLDVTPLVFTQFSGAGQIDAGPGLYKNGNLLGINGTANRLTVTADGIDIASTYVGQTSITTLGTITTGVWHGTIIDEIYGGTGNNSYVKGDILYASDVNVLSKLAGNSDTTRKFMQMSSTNPTWEVLLNGDIPAALSGKTYEGLSITTGANTFTLTSGTSTLTRVGAHSLTLTTTGLTNVVLPTSGTLLSTAMAVTIAQGGTGATTAAQARANLGCITKVTRDIGDGSATSITVNHGLNTMDVAVSLRANAAPYEMALVDTVIVDANNIRFEFAEAPTANQYKVIIIG